MSKTLRIYSFHSGTNQYLKHQIDAIRKNISHDALTLVIDEFCEKRHVYSSEELAYAKPCDIKYMPQGNAGRKWPWASREVYNYALNSLVSSQKEDLALLLHGDTFPIQPINCVELLGDNAAYGAGNENSTHYKVHTCWLIVNAKTLNYPVDVFSLTEFKPIHLCEPILTKESKSIVQVYLQGFIHARGMSMFPPEEIQKLLEICIGFSSHSSSQAFWKGVTNPKTSKKIFL